MAYLYKKPQRSKIFVPNDRVEGETIEQRIERMINNKEPITDGAPEIYTERKDGVAPQYNVRTDRFEIAAEAMDKVHRSDIAKRDSVLKAVDKDDDNADKVDDKADKGDGVAEGKSVDGTDG